MSRRRHKNRPAVLVVAHSEYACMRAAQLVGGWADAQVVGPFSGMRGARKAAFATMGTRPRLVYLVDVGLSTTVCAPIARALGARVIVDTGDLAYRLARSVGSRSLLGLGSVWTGERLALALAHHVVVRGKEHARFVRKRRITYAPDLAPPTARPSNPRPVRSELGLEQAFVVGLVGSLNVAPRRGTVYGWEIVEALHYTPEDVAALIIGDGDGLCSLEQRARALGVAERCHFIGRVPPEAVSTWVSAMDVGISTQTNDPVGMVRTTGKLPLYLSCGVPVLASDVGEARRLLGPLGWTVRYDGVVDTEYPRRLAAAIARVAGSPETAQIRRAQALELARRAFDPREVRRTVMSAIEQELGYAPGERR